MKNIAEEKPILAIETSESLCGACVYFSDKIFFEVNIQLKNSHAEKLFDAVDYVIKSAQIELKDLKAIAISAGPGSFTGLRIGFSAAKGIAFAVNLPIILVPTFEAMALQICSILPEGTEFIIANKVNVEEVYYAKFKVKSNNYIFAEDLQVLKHIEFEKKIEDTLLFGNASVNSFLNNGEVNLSSPKPQFIAKWAYLFGKDILTFDYDYLEPNYFKNFIIKERNHA